MNTSILLFSLLIGLPAWGDPGLGLIGPKERLSSCRNQTRKGYSFSPNELILSIKTYKDPTCRQLAEINRYKMTCKFSDSDESAVCTHTGRGRSADGSNWDTLPVENEGLRVQVKAKALADGKIEVYMVDANSVPTQDVLK